MARWIANIKRALGTQDEQPHIANQHALPAKTPYPDVPRTHPAFHAVSRLKQLGVIKGFSDGHFRGHQPMTRYEFATVLNNLRLARILPG
jgi:hypothetical protein